MEYLDVCDENGIPTGETVERETAHQNGICHRTAHVWVLRKERGRYEILLQKRSDCKDSYPGCYDTSSAGHVPAGDEPLDSGIRELSEELGLYAEKSDLMYAGSFRNRYETVFHEKAFRDNEVSFVYVLSKEVDISGLRLQKEELSEVRWFDLLYVYGERLKGNPDFCVTVSGLKVLMKFLGLKIDNQGISTYNGSLS